MDRMTKVAIALIAILVVMMLSGAAVVAITSDATDDYEYEDETHMMVVNDKQYAPEEKEPDEDKADEVDEPSESESEDDKSDKSEDIEISSDLSEDMVEQATYEPESYNTPSKSYFRNAGVMYDDNFKFTWYSSQVLYHRDTYKWHTDDEGYWRTDEGYLVVASSEYSGGTILESDLFGTMQVLDSGCAVGVIDVYVSW